MARLTRWLLDPSLLNYTLQVTGTALRTTDPLLKQQAIKRAGNDLDFFFGHPRWFNRRRERAARYIFRKYRTALSDPDIAEVILEDLPGAAAVSATHERNSSPASVSALHTVLSLQDPRHYIFISFNPHEVKHAYTLKRLLDLSYISLCRATQPLEMLP
ncbi:hypothetical protein CPC08DRAFT_767245 [Agrocybe pediades]|nr:hypothetical protein CPC08DRAFT_767245 [Agrocybe pediades]